MAKGKTLNEKTSANDNSKALKSKAVEKNKQQKPRRKILRGFFVYLNQRIERFKTLVTAGVGVIS